MFYHIIASLWFFCTKQNIFALLYISLALFTCTFEYCIQAPRKLASTPHNAGSSEAGNGKSFSSCPVPTVNHICLLSVEYDNVIDEVKPAAKYGKSGDF